MGVGGGVEGAVDFDDADAQAAGGPDGVRGDEAVALEAVGLATHADSGSGPPGGSPRRTRRAMRRSSWPRASW